MKFTLKFSSLVSIALLSLTPSIYSANFVWTGTCGNSSWNATCQGEPCAVIFFYIQNNWGEEECGSEPAFPSSSDTVTLAGGPVELIGSASIYQLIIQSMSNTELMVSGPSSVLAVYSGIENHGSLSCLDRANLSVLGENCIIANSGEIHIGLPEQGSGGSMNLQANATLQGSGELIIRNNGSITGSGYVLFNDSNHTISGGSGFINCDLRNHGTITANISDEILMLESQGGIDNSGLLVAENEGNLVIECDIFLDEKVDKNRRPSEHALIADHSRITLYSDYISGMDLYSYGDGLCYVEGGVALTLTNVRNFANVQFARDSTLILENVLENNGTIDLTLGDATFVSSVSVPEIATLTGGGKIVLDTGEIVIAPGQVLTNSQHHTIQGRNNISGGLINHGIVRSSFPNSTLTLYGDGMDIHNYGWLIAEDSTNLEITQPSQLQTHAGSRIYIQGNLHSYGGIEISEGSVTGTGRVYSDLTVNGGTVKPGTYSNPGTLHIEGDYTQSANGTLTVELAAASGSLNASQLAVTGTASLDGDLRIIPIKGFLPQPGQSFTVLDASSISFSSLDVVSSGTFDISYDQNQVVLTVISSPLSPDHNLDGFINILDLVVQVGTNGGIKVGPVDMDGDAEVDLDDLLILVGNWNESL
ncbi:MAG: hypothetical protein CR997_13825 [Acidobacteria bacterium]|nr:MAG: hypothetical protein CR997_13825 [Acidobacteriota bacterium]